MDLGLGQSLNIPCADVDVMYMCVSGERAPEEDGHAAASEHLPAPGD